MGVFVFLPLTALPIARLAEQHLHPRATTRLLTLLAAVLGLCSTLCLGLLVVGGAARARAAGPPLAAGADPGRSGGPGRRGGHGRLRRLRAQRRGSAVRCSEGSNAPLGAH
ncbi:hypothetical protein SAMN05428954_3773 [Streptomyces sp. 2112.3]|nr:hypothetical protein SAMN05428954_3773 [Streptomyces sp. 2112.3]